MRCGTMATLNDAVAFDCRDLRSALQTFRSTALFIPGAQRLQNAGVSKAMKLSISRRPSNMASVHTQIWKSVSTA